MQGNSTNDQIEVDLPQMPDEVMLNYNHDVLAVDVKSNRLN